jgi:hypothetical protein
VVSVTAARCTDELLIWNGEGKEDKSGVLGMHTAYACMHPNVYWTDSELDWTGLDWQRLKAGKEANKQQRWRLRGRETLAWPLTLLLVLVE